MWDLAGGFEGGVRRGMSLLYKRGRMIDECGIS